MRKLPLGDLAVKKNIVFYYLILQKVLTKAHSVFSVVLAGPFSESSTSSRSFGA